MSKQAARIELGEGMWAEVVGDKYNPLVKRRELSLIVHHESKSTPMRINLRVAVAEKLGADIQRVYVRSIYSEYGVGVSRAGVYIYDTVERALAFEPKYSIERNGGVNPFEG